MADAENSKQPRGTPFPKGRSGNAGGRPKGYNAFRKSFRGEKDSEKIRARLRAIMEDGEDRDAIAAAKLWVEYGWGRPPAAPEDNAALRESGNRLPVGLTAEQVLSIARGEKPE